MRQAGHLVMEQFSEVAVSADRALVVVTHDQPNLRIRRHHRRNGRRQGDRCRARPKYWTQPRELRSPRQEPERTSCDVSRFQPSLLPVYCSPSSGRSPLLPSTRQPLHRRLRRRACLRTRWEPGLVEPESENIDISCPVSGLVTAVYVGAGDRVHAGQRLFSLDDREPQAELREKETALEAAGAKLKKLEEEPRAEDIPPAEAKVREAQADLSDAEVQMKLIESVTDRRAVREEDVQRRRIAFQAAQARLNEAKSQLELLKAGDWAPDLAVARADVAQADAQVREVRTNIERLTMTAPMDGVILQKRVRPGQFAECGPTSEALMIMGGDPT